MRLHSLDTLKFICALLVVFLHVPTPLRQYYLPITRCAVPCFFIISGYLLWSDEMDSRMRKGALRILKIIICSSILYTLQKLIANHFDIHSIIPSGKLLFYFLVFNKNPWGFHLWYLGAYLYVLLICIIIGKYKLWNLAYIIVPFLLIADILLGKYSLLILGYEIHYWYLRNWIFVGFPFFLIGTYIKKTRINIRESVVLGGVIVFSITSIVENRLLVNCGLNATRDQYISTVFLSVFLFLLFLQKKQDRSNIISKIGNNDSLYIYIFHPVYIWLFSLINYILPSIWKDVVYQYLAPLIVFFITVTSIYVLRKLYLIK